MTNWVKADDLYDVAFILVISDLKELTKVYVLCTMFTLDSMRANI